MNSAAALSRSEPGTTTENVPVDIYRELYQREIRIINNRLIAVESQVRALSSQLPMRPDNAFPASLLNSAGGEDSALDRLVAAARSRPNGWVTLLDALVKISSIASPVLILLLKSRPS